MSIGQTFYKVKVTNRNKPHARLINRTSKYRFILSYCIPLPTTIAPEFRFYGGF